MLASVANSIARLSPAKAYPKSDKLIALGLVLLFVYSWATFFNVSVPEFSISQLPAEPIRNSTLGFQEIYALALAERDDRIQPLLDAAKATNLSLTILNAARDSEISEDAWPKDWREKDHKKGELGCLISHVRTWNKMIAHNISTALIMESDADWDMRIKEIMPQLAQGIKTLVDWPFNRPHHTQDARFEPYGDTWDVIWIGHCGSRHQGNTRIYSWNDTSVPPEDREWRFGGSLTDEQHAPGTRTVFQFDAAVCSTAYAISLRGATKLTRHFKAANLNIDIQLSDFCTGKARGNVDMVCLAVWPQIVTNSDSESNIVDGKDDKGAAIESEIKAGPAIQFSARMNARKVLEEGIGEADWKAEWDTRWAEKNGTWDMVSRKKVVMIDGD